GIMALLMHADGAVHAVVDDDEHGRGAVLERGRQLLPVHQEAAIAVERDDDSIGMHQLRYHSRRRAVPHGAAGWRELRAKAPELVKAMRPDRVVAGAVAEN